MSFVAALASANLWGYKQAEDTQLSSQSVLQVRDVSVRLQSVWGARRAHLAWQAGQKRRGKERREGVGDVLNPRSRQGGACNSGAGAFKTPGAVLSVRTVAGTGGRRGGRTKGAAAQP